MISYCLDDGVVVNARPPAGSVVSNFKAAMAAEAKYGRLGRTAWM